MTPDEAARHLREELQDLVADLGGGAAKVTVHAVAPPPDLGADTCFRVTVSAEPQRPIEVALPTTLAMGYLADEEAAVDEWRLWVHDLLERLNS